jgi:hypothetical protein
VTLAAGCPAEPLAMAAPVPTPAAAITAALTRMTICFRHESRSPFPPAPGFLSFQG